MPDREFSPFSQKTKLCTELEEIEEYRTDDRSFLSFFTNWNSK